MRQARFLTILSLLLPLLALPAAWAQTNYRLQVIAARGDIVGDARLDDDIDVGTLDDRGDLTFNGNNRYGGRTIFRSADGKVTPLLVGGGEAPGGSWPKSRAAVLYGNVNQRGNIVFGARISIGSRIEWGTFRWDAATGQFSAVAVPGMPAVNDLTFLSGEPGVVARINNQGEVAFVAFVKNASGNAERAAFFRDRNGKLWPVFLPGQTAPGGSVSLELTEPLVLNDAGQVALRARPSGSPTSETGAYLWDQGQFTPLASVGTDAPGGAKIVRVTGVWLNNQNREVLVAARVSSSPTQSGLYRLAGGQLHPVVTPGQEMPGGSRLATVSQTDFGPFYGVAAWRDVSLPNDKGQYVFNARLEDGTRALYLLDADGKLSLALKKGMATPLGEITTIRESMGLALNTRGQIAAMLGIAGRHPALVMLTPSAP